MYEGVKSKVFSLQNAANARVFGIQAGFEVFFFDNLSWSVQANWIEGNETDDTKDEDVPLRHAPPVYGNTHVKFTNKRLNIDVYALYNGEISNNNLAPSERAKTAIYATDKNGKPFSPRWYTLNIKTAFQLGTNLSIGAGWENISNQRYRAYSSGIVSPGSNLVFSLRTGF
jgi:hemoglobin/transferrin/lactoferrin receptor protein